MKNYLDKLYFVVQGNPISKSNFSLHGKNGKKILPQNSAFSAYEEEIAFACAAAAAGKTFKKDVIFKVKVYFKTIDKHTDLVNIPKSLCDGIEKSGVIANDRYIRNVYLEEFYDKLHPRLEVSIYNKDKYKVKVDIIEDDTKQCNCDKADVKDKETISHIVCDYCGKPILNKKKAKKLKNENKYICTKCLFGAGA